MRDFAFVQTAPGRLFVGWGPFEQLPFRRPERPAFYVSDFFLDDPHPWRHPAEWEEIATDEFASRFAASAPLRIDWEPLPAESFASLFGAAREAMQRNEFAKVVPVMFEKGQVTGDRSQVAGGLLGRLASLPRELWAYGYSYGTHGMVGATPELLFRSETWRTSALACQDHESEADRRGRLSSITGYATMALAGTRAIERAGELLHDAKELREHRLVVDDIVRRLSPFGNIEVGPLGVLELPSIAHLATPIRFEESGGSEKMSFAEMVRRLHPTAALGVSPRTDAGLRWLREADRGVKRRTFGAPFGLEREDRSAIAVVAIRNVQWSGSAVRVGSGAGLLIESRLERELEELRQKRDQVKALFGIEALLPAAATLS
jgi:menaquinone-specific isochorismate synthase